MARDALAHRLQTVEQPSPILLVIEQAIDLPPVSRLRLLILAQDVIERVRGPHHGRPPQPSSVWELPGSAVLQFARCKWGSRPKLLSFVAPASSRITPRSPIEYCWASRKDADHSVLCNKGEETIRSSRMIGKGMGKVREWRECVVVIRDRT